MHFDAKSVPPLLALVAYIIYMDDPYVRISDVALWFVLLQHNLQQVSRILLERLNLYSLQPAPPSASPASAETATLPLDSVDTATLLPAPADIESSAIQTAE